MAEQNDVIKYILKIGDKDFSYDEKFHSYTLDNLLKLTSNKKNIKRILEDKRFSEELMSRSDSDIDEPDSFDYMSQFDLLYNVYKKIDEEKIPELYAATKNLRNFIYQEKIHLSLLNNYSNLDYVDTGFTPEEQKEFEKLFSALKSILENDGSQSLQNLATLIDAKKYPSDFNDTLKNIRVVIDDKDTGKPEKIRKIDAELSEYAKLRSLLFDKVVYATKVLNHYTVPVSFLNKYFAAFCGTSTVPKNTNNSYEYLFNKIQSNISKNMAALNIANTGSNAFQALLQTNFLKKSMNKELLDKQDLICVAFLIDPVQNYFSFNGNDFTACVYPLMKKQFEEILAGENFKYAKLEKDTRSFYRKKYPRGTPGGVWNEKELIGFPEFFTTFEKVNNKESRLFNCCERKILTSFGYRELHSYYLMVTMEPCRNCQMAINFSVKDDHTDFQIGYFEKDNVYRVHKSKSYSELCDIDYFN